MGPCPRAPPLPLPSRANSPCALLPLRPRRGDKGCCAHHTAAPKLLMGGTAQGTAAQRGRASSDDIPRDRGSAQELLRLSARAMGAIGWIFGDPASSESAAGPVLTRVSSKEVVPEGIPGTNGDYKSVLSCQSHRQGAQVRGVSWSINYYLRPNMPMAA